ncbi:MAG: hypothetical protein LBE98_03190 [Puniceicoccales bacterium]|jgi:hypothetical protein|nr:hypothetical protein [Puniceicoccales bacterium]
MKKEYEEILESAKKAFVRYDVAVQKTRKKYPAVTQKDKELWLEFLAADRKDSEIMLEGLRTIEKLVKIAAGDLEILCELFYFFLEENENTYDFCEKLNDLIDAYFNDDEMLRTYYQKFDLFAWKNPERCVSIATMSFYDFYENIKLRYEKFRKMFNTVRSKHSGRFIEELKKRSKCGKWSDEEKDRIYALEEDMKNW